MTNHSLHLISPAVAPTDKSEAELFGAMVWLWMHSGAHRNCPVHELQRLLIPALKTGQYVLALQNNAQQQPIGLMTWACFTADMEQRYLQTLDRTLTSQDWQQGDRPWILDWLSPFGQTRRFVKAAQNLLNQACLRTLYHRGDERGMRILYFRGQGITSVQETEFWRSRPLPLSVPGNTSPLLGIPQ